MHPVLFLDFLVRGVERLSFLLMAWLAQIALCTSFGADCNSCTNHYRVNLHYVLSRLEAFEILSATRKCQVVCQDVWESSHAFTAGQLTVMKIGHKAHG